MANEVFLSYTRIKEGPEHIITSFHDRLQQKLKEKTRDEISIFFDVEDLTPGAKYSEQIEATIHDARIFLLLLSPSWIQSNWCVQEYKCFAESMRDNHNKALLPILWTGVRENLLTEAERNLFKEVSEYQRVGKKINWERLKFFNGESPIADDAVLDLADELADTLVLLAVDRPS